MWLLQMRWAFKLRVSLRKLKFCEQSKSLHMLHSKQGKRAHVCVRSMASEQCKPLRGLHGKQVKRALENAPWQASQANLACAPWQAGFECAPWQASEVSPCALATAEFGPVGHINSSIQKWRNNKSEEHWNEKLFLYEPCDVFIKITIKCSIWTGTFKWVYFWYTR